MPDRVVAMAGPHEPRERADEHGSAGGGEAPGERSRVVLVRDRRPRRRRAVRTARATIPPAVGTARCDEAAPSSDGERARATASRGEHGQRRCRARARRRARRAIAAPVPHHPSCRWGDQPPHRCSRLESPGSSAGDPTSTAASVHRDGTEVRPDRCDRPRPATGGHRRSTLRAVTCRAQAVLVDARRVNA